MDLTEVRAGHDARGVELEAAQRAADVEDRRGVGGGLRLRPHRPAQPDPTTLLAELWLVKPHHALAIRRSVVAAGGLGSKLCLRMKIDGRPPVILTTVEADVSPPP